ncbi:winged helix-turn-helix domain-containing protein [Natronorubrum sp. DTA7]|uniref:winged helix-turn-helix domain-containing protein n=1 Tax=Natronorubrum sp. DTA7 TaxID=3447016 RepID=UPI003F84A887
MSDEPDPDAERREIEPNGELVADSVDDIIAANAFVELLGNSSRAKILAVLAGTQTPVNPSAIADAADISRDTFYRHFETFEEYGVVEQVGEAANAPLYSMTETDLARALEMVADHAGERKRTREGVRDGMDHE